jgi:hypothetical protein
LKWFVDEQPDIIEVESRSLRRNRDAVLSDYWVVVLWTLRGTVVIVQHATHSLAAANTSLGIRSPERLNQLVIDALMVALAMIVGDEFGHCLRSETAAGISDEPLFTRQKICQCGIETAADLPHHSRAVRWSQSGSRVAVMR